MIGSYKWANDGFEGRTGNYWDSCFWKKSKILKFLFWKLCSSLPQSFAKCTYVFSKTSNILLNEHVFFVCVGVSDCLYTYCIYREDIQELSWLDGQKSFLSFRMIELEQKFCDRFEFSILCKKEHILQD